MNHNHHPERSRPAPSDAKRRRNRGWRFVLVPMLAGAACALGAYLFDGEVKVILAGLSLILITVAVYSGMDVLLWTRSVEPIESGEAPPITPLPQSPVTLVHDPGSPPNKSFERTQEG
jgi:hypothetical protein